MAYWFVGFVRGAGRGLRNGIIPTVGAFCLTLGASLGHAGEHGLASVYKHGTRTANGERFVPSAMAAAHRRFPFNTHVRVTNVRNHRSVVVRINDRGPFVRGRVIDLTPAGARALGFTGLVPVIVERTASK